MKMALLSYMLEHNEHHAAGLAQMAAELDEKGMSEAAKKIRESVANFERDNTDLSDALKLIK